MRTDSDDRVSIAELLRDGAALMPDDTLTRSAWRE